MEAFFMHLSDTMPMAFLVIGGFVDMLFVTGYVFYGFALMSGVTVLHMTGRITVPEILVAAYIGTLLGAYTNYAIGYFFGATKTVQKILNSERVKRVEAKLSDSNLFVIMFVCRFVTFLRPAYMLTLGALRLHPRAVLSFEPIIAAVWVVFWTAVLVFGEQVVMFVSRFLLTII
ncbi:MAG: VTT domain-containing protein [Candidatus Paceibacterota bacterium]